MNFVHMPELNWTFGYPLAIVLMVLTRSSRSCSSATRNGSEGGFAHA